jgi:hypothetical protein
MFSMLAEAHRASLFAAALIIERLFRSDARRKMERMPFSRVIADLTPN